MRGGRMTSAFAVRAFPLFSESRKCSDYFLRNSERKTAAHFCWNCFGCDGAAAGTVIIS